MKFKVRRHPFLSRPFFCLLLLPRSRPSKHRKRSGSGRTSLDGGPEGWRWERTTCLGPFSTSKLSRCAQVVRGREPRTCSVQFCTANLTFKTVFKLTFNHSTCFSSRRRRRRKNLNKTENRSYELSAQEVWPCPGASLCVKWEYKELIFFPSLLVYCEKWISPPLTANLFFCKFILVHKLNLTSAKFTFFSVWH